MTRHLITQNFFQPKESTNQCSKNTPRKEVKRNQRSKINTSHRNPEINNMTLQSFYKRIYLAERPLYGILRLICILLISSISSVSASTTPPRFGPNFIIASNGVNKNNLFTDKCGAYIEYRFHFVGDKTMDKRIIDSKTFELKDMSGNWVGRIIKVDVYDIPENKDDVFVEHKKEKPNRLPEVNPEDTKKEEDKPINEPDQPNTPTPTEPNTPAPETPEPNKKQSKSSTNKKILVGIGIALVLLVVVFAIFLFKNICENVEE